MKTVAKNRKSYYDYHILERFDAGIVLTGTEIKSVAAGKIDLTDSYISINGYDAEVLGMSIARYANGTCWNHEEKRARKLLLHKDEMRRLGQKAKEQGLTIVPLSVYIHDNGKAKLEIALAKGKHNYDKREAIKKRDIDRALRRKV